MRQEGANDTEENVGDDADGPAVFCDSKPMTLPMDKQQELAAALPDLLLNAAVESDEPEREERV